MKKGIVTAICISLSYIVLSGISLAAELSQRTQNVINNVNQKENLIKSIENLQQLTPSEMKEFAQYIEFHSEQIPPIYFILMADYIYTSDKDKAALWYYVGKLRSYQDVLMCQDTTAQSQVKLYPIFAPKTMKYLAKKENNKKYIINLFQKALDWDNKHPQRVEPIWACRLGLNAKVSEPKINPTKKREQVIEEVRNDLIESIEKMQKSL